MIYAKTKLKKIPKTCKDCPLSEVRYFGFRDAERCCPLMKKLCPMEKKPSGNMGYGKPTWCPLREAKDPSIDVCHLQIAYSSIMNKYFYTSQHKKELVNELIKSFKKTYPNLSDSIVLNLAKTDIDDNQFYELFCPNIIMEGLY